MVNGDVELAGHSHSYLFVFKDNILKGNAVFFFVKDPSFLVKLFVE